MPPSKRGALSSTARRKLHPWRGSELLMLPQPLVLPGTPLFVHIWPPRLSSEKRFPNYNKRRERSTSQVRPFISDPSLFRWLPGRPESAEEEQRDREKLFNTWQQKGNVLNRALRHSQHYLQNDLPTSPGETQKWRLCGHHHLQPTRSLSHS